MVMTIVIVAAFQDLANMSNAYGFAVATVMFSTSVLIAIQIRAIKHLPIILGVVYFLTFGFFDGMLFIYLQRIFVLNIPIALFWGAALNKVPHGGWVPLLIGIILSVHLSFVAIGSHYFYL